MKKLLLFSLLLVAISTLLVKSQTPCDDWSPCTPAASWVNEDIPIAADTLGCEMLIYYRWRIMEF